MFSRQEYTKRRENLTGLIRNTFGIEKGIVLLFGGVENYRDIFRQESSFYYFTGVKEPGSVFLMDLDNKSTLYIPNLKDRFIWYPLNSNLTTEELGMEKVEFLGDQSNQPCASPIFQLNEYKNLIARLKNFVSKKYFIFTFNQKLEQLFLFNRLSNFIPDLQDRSKDISSLIGAIRRKKSSLELELISQAVNITAKSFDYALNVIKPGVNEREVQAAIEYYFTISNAQKAAPSIIASGANSTILHYHLNNKVMKKGDLVLIDIGAEYNYYCSDLTRVFPVDSKFLKRHKEIYDLVLDTQEYIASIAKPGFSLINIENEELSLTHLAKKFLSFKGYDKYFVHGIGHFLGLDPHDVGNVFSPLMVGDVFTLEPGIYIPEENIGIRIEDDFVMTEKGACRLVDIPRDTESIELAMRQINKTP